MILKISDLQFEFFVDIQICIFHSLRDLTLEPDHVFTLQLLVIANDNLMRHMKMFMQCSQLHFLRNFVQSFSSTQIRIFILWRALQFLILMNFVTFAHSLPDFNWLELFLLGDTNIVVLHFAQELGIVLVFCDECELFLPMEVVNNLVVDEFLVF